VSRSSDPSSAAPPDLAVPSGSTTATVATLRGRGTFTPREASIGCCATTPRCRLSGHVLQSDPEARTVRALAEVIEIGREPPRSSHMSLFQREPRRRALPPCPGYPRQPGGRLLGCCAWRSGQVRAGTDPVVIQTIPTMTASTSNGLATRSIGPRDAPSRSTAPAVEVRRLVQTVSKHLAAVHRARRSGWRTTAVAASLALR